jgi:dimeric dUTPase (all-alpha-NTP-PPase superfamily)
MLEMQMNLNCKIDSNWIELNREWYRAAYVEAAELVNSLPFKWWKKQTVDFDNAKIEIVDMFHFIMSDNIVKYEGHIEMISDYYDTVYDDIYEKEMPNELLIKEVLNHLDKLILHLIDGNFAYIITHFFSVMFLFRMDINELYKMYIGKQVLNKFRQDNGYKEGTYIKIWKDQEDNVYLHTILGQCDVDNDLENYVYQQLQLIYSNL